MNRQLASCKKEVNKRFTFLEIFFFNFSFLNSSWKNFHCFCECSKNSTDMKRRNSMQVKRRKQRNEINFRQIPRKKCNEVFPIFFISQRIFAIFCMLQTADPKNINSKWMNNLQIERKTQFSSKLLFQETFFSAFAGSPTRKLSTQESSKTNNLSEKRHKIPYFISIF